MAGLGFDAALIRDTDEDFKAKVGWLAYLGGLVRAIRGRRRSRYLITIDERPAGAPARSACWSATSAQLQGGVALLPDADPDDGAAGRDHCWRRDARRWTGRC